MINDHTCLFGNLAGVISSEQHTKAMVVVVWRNCDRVLWGKRNCFLRFYTFIAESLSSLASKLSVFLTLYRVWGIYMHCSDGILGADMVLLLS